MAACTPLQWSTATLKFLSHTLLWTATPVGLHPATHTKYHAFLKPLSKFVVILFALVTEIKGSKQSLCHLPKNV